MANVQAQFEQFHARIRTDYEMNATLRDKRDIILNRIRRYLTKHGLPRFDEMHQGSYKLKTGTIPIHGLEYDIDVGLRFNFTEHDYAASVVRGWVYAAVDGHTENVDEKNSCIRVTYADGYHVDLVVYARWVGGWGAEHYRLAHKSKGWRKADPIGLIDHIKRAREPFADTKDSATQTDQFRRCVRCLRRWIDEAIPTVSKAKPSGLAFVLLATQSLRPCWSWHGAPDDCQALERLAASAASTWGRIVAEKPTPEYEDMFAGLSDRDMDALKTRLATLATALRLAEKEPNQREACKILQGVFGTDFPVPDPEDTVKKTSAPAIVPSSASA